MVGTPEMVDSVNKLILADRWIAIEDISGQLGISVRGGLTFSKLGWVLKMLTPEHKASFYSKNSGNNLLVWLRIAATSFFAVYIWSYLISTCLASSNNICVE